MFKFWQYIVGGRQKRSHQKGEVTTGMVGTTGVSQSSGCNLGPLVICGLVLLYSCVVV